MASNNPKLHSARLKAQTKIYNLLDKLEGKKGLDGKAEGFNAKQYKLYFDSMDDKAFMNFMKRLANEEWFNLRFEIDMLNDKDTPSMKRIKRVATEYKIPLEEYVAYPFKNKNDLEHPPISQSEVPVVYTIIRPLQQMLDKKQAYASDNDSTNLLTGQVTGKSKASTFSNMQTIALTTSNQTDVVKEMLGPRSDDEESKAKMIAQIEDTGDFDVNSISIRTKDKQSLETIRVMLIGAGFRVAFGTDKLSYILPKE